MGCVSSSVASVHPSSDDESEKEATEIETREASSDESEVEKTGMAPQEEPNAIASSSAATTHDESTGKDAYRRYAFHHR